jgi:hypothetical protein
MMRFLRGGIAPGMAETAMEMMNKLLRPSDMGNFRAFPAVASGKLPTDEEKIIRCSCL